MSDERTSKERVAELRHLRNLLKTGEYMGTDIMLAWIALAEYADLLEQRTAHEPRVAQHEIALLADLLEQCSDFLFDDSGTPIAPLELRERVRAALDRHSLPPNTGDAYAAGYADGLAKHPSREVIFRSKSS